MFVRDYVPLEARLRTLLAPGFKAAIDDSIINLLDTTVRQLLLTGLPEFGLPVLDPLQVEHLDLNVDLDTIQ